jgi:hypothetical protein
MGIIPFNIKSEYKFCHKYLLQIGILSYKLKTSIEKNAILLKANAI